MATRNNNNAQQQQQQQPPESGIEVDLRWYVTGLGVIMAFSFMAGLQQSPLGQQPDTLLTTTSSHHHNPQDNVVVHNHQQATTSSNPNMPHGVSDRSKIVRDAFLVPETGDDDPAGQNVDEQPLTFDPTAAAAGEHLLVDIEGVDADFLDSESRLAQAMVDTTKEAGLELLSYHCHSLEPKGVSCVGVLLESHMSFHTWPDEGVITLDLYVTTVSTNTEQQAKQQPLVPNVVDSIKRLFGIRGAGKAPRPLNARWSHEFRGFDPAAAKGYDDGTVHLAGSDLALWVLSPLEMYSKELIHSSFPQTNQRVDIWDLVEVTDTPSAADVERHGLQEGDPRLMTPELVMPARCLFLNGKHIATMEEERVMMETIVHPALFAHSKPQQATIVAGPASLANGLIREVLKHATIESLTVWQATQELAEVIAPKYLSDLNNCTRMKGRNENCLKDPLVDLKYYREKPVSNVLSSKAAPTKKQDAIFLLDFEAFLRSTDNVPDMVSGWMDALSDEGVLLLPLGHAAAIHDPRPDLGVHALREELMLALEATPSVAALLVYEEAHCGSLEPESFLLVCKDASCRKRWYARSDQVEYQIYDRLIRLQHPEGATVKKPILSYYDGTTQRSYQWPKKGWEAVYCKREPTPWECAYTHLNQYAEFHEIDVEDESKGSFRMEVKYKGDDDETDGSGKEEEEEDDDDNEIEETRIFATKNIPKGSYIMAEHLASSLMLTSRNLEGLLNNTKTAAAGADGKEGRAAIIEDLLEFFEEHGHDSIMEGSEQHYIEVGGTALIRKTDHLEEANIEPWVPRRRTPKPKYSPVYERHRMSIDVFVVASRDIAAGEEIVAWKDMWSKPTVD